MTNEVPAPNQVEPNPTMPVSANPARQAFNVTVSVPENITVRMVDASSLSDYEVNIFISSLAFGFFTAFAVPAVQELKAGSQLAAAFTAMTLLAGVIFLTFLVMALSKRKKLTETGKEIKLTTTGAEIGG
jgi:hypothetical protein